MDLKFSSWREPTFTLYLDSIVESLCKPWVGLSCNVMCSVLLYCYEYACYVNVKVCNHLCLVFPSLGVASLSPRMGGEPPWFPIFVSLLQVLLDDIGDMEFM